MWLTLNGNQAAFAARIAAPFPSLQFQVFPLRGLMSRAGEIREKPNCRRRSIWLDAATLLVASLWLMVSISWSPLLMTRLHGGWPHLRCRQRYYFDYIWCAVFWLAGSFLILFNNLKMMASSWWEQNMLQPEISAREKKQPKNLVLYHQMATVAVKLQSARANVFHQRQSANVWCWKVLIVGIFRACVVYSFVVELQHNISDHQVFLMPWSNK